MGPLSLPICRLHLRCDPTPLERPSRGGPARRALPGAYRRSNASARARSRDRSQHRASVPSLSELRFLPGNRRQLCDARSRASGSARRRPHHPATWGCNQSVGLKADHSASSFAPGCCPTLSIPNALSGVLSKTWSLEEPRHSCSSPARTIPWSGLSLHSSCARFGALALMRKDCRRFLTSRQCTVMGVAT